MNTNATDKVRAMLFSKIYPLYVAKGERKGCKQEEIDAVISWLTGYTKKDIIKKSVHEVTLEEFFAKAPMMNPKRSLITGTVCGVRIETIQDPFMKDVRYLDKLVDELAQGKPLEKILRQ